MQNRSNTRSSLVAQSASRKASQVIRLDSRGRPSNTLQRAGSVLSAELVDRLSGSPATTPPSAVSNSLAALSSSCSHPIETASGSTSTAVLAASGELPSTPPEDGAGSSCGLTPASLKHLRRQNQKLTEEKDSLKKDLESSQVVIRELRERIAALEEQLRESEERQEKLQHELAEARQGEEAQRNRADEAERLNARLEESLATKEAEVARLRQALEEQLQLTKEVCEAAERSSGEARVLAESADEIARLKEQVNTLQQERDALQKDKQRQELESAALQQRTAAAIAAAEKAMSMHAHHLQRVEQLRVAKLSDAIQQKVELHISVPRVTLSYNNAPPLIVSIASALGDHRIKEFLDVEVFPHFEPLWATLDAMDKAPDGTTKKAYSSRMLERLTEAVKGFVEKSQRSDAESGLTPTVREPLYGQDGTLVDSAHNRSSESQKSSVIGGTSNAEGRRTSQADREKARSLSIGESALQRQSVGDSNSKKHATSEIIANSESRATRNGQGSAPACAMDSLAEADRDRLLCLLRSGDDRGLDSKLKDLLQSHG